jgi:hypothetical protein
MKSFSFKSTHFELTLEGFDDPVEVFKQVVEGLSSKTYIPSTENLDTQATDNKKVIATECNPEMDIDEFFAGNKPTKLRAILERSVEYLSKCKGITEFTKEQLYEVAKSSLNYDVSWSKNRTNTFNRMITAGFIAKRPEGKYVLK